MHLDGDPRYQTVTCGRCGRVYTCTPLDDWWAPAPQFGWTKGNVCWGCFMVITGIAGNNLGTEPPETGGIDRK